MTPQEFKAWFDGFTEAFTGVPTKAQWARVKERVAEIDGRPVTERVYMDRYYPIYPSYPHRYWTTFNAVGVGASTLGSAGNTISGTSASNLAQTQSFNSTDALYALGKADGQALS